MFPIDLPIDGFSENVIIPRCALESFTIYLAKDTSMPFGDMKYIIFSYLEYA
jgi:hypothetical protein